MTADCDVAIVGGGMVGMLLALALSKTLKNIVLVDASSPTPSTEDHRLIALTHTSCDWLSYLGLWPALEKQATAIHTIHVSQKGRFGITRLHAHDIQQDTLGHVIPAKYINAALQDHLQQQPHVTRIQPAKVIALSQHQDRVNLTLQHNQLTESLDAKIVFGVDGSHSTIRQLLAVPVETLPSTQKALVTITHLNRHHDHIAYERFHETGALAMLPLSGHRVATIWTDSIARIDTLLTQSDEVFLQTLQTQMGYRLGKFLRCDTRYSYPLEWIEVKPEHQKVGRVLLLGNAAHTLHPIAAQGLNVALHEIRALSHYFLTCSEKSIQLPEQLTYINKQKTSFQLSKKLTEFFLLQQPPIAILRNMGLLILDQSTHLRKEFLKRAIQ